MPEITARIAGLLLAGAFAWAAVAKVFVYRRWRQIVTRYGLPSGLDAVIAPVVPVGEAAIATTIVGFEPRVGAAAALAALSLFSFAIVRARSITGDRLPCGCFGGGEDRHYRTMLWRNAALGGLAAVVLFARPQHVLTRPSFPTGAELIPAALVVVGVALALWTALQALGVFRGRELR